MNDNQNERRTESQKSRIRTWFLNHPDQHITWMDVLKMFGSSKAATRIGEIIEDGLRINRDNRIEVATMDGGTARVTDYFLPREEAERWIINHLNK